MATLQAAQVITEKSSFWNFKSKYEFVDDWFLMGSPYPLLGLTTLYLLFVLKLGPELLKNRKPFELKTVIVVYNALQVGLSLVMFYICCDLTSKLGVIQRTCVNYTHDLKLQITTAVYYYFLCKVTELLDTIFFVLRKKANQVTFLHVYHHTMMAWSGWFFLRFDPGSWMLLLGILNCFVHVLMYGYYGLSSFPSLHKYLWWKKYITSMQLIQFVLLLVHLTIGLWVSECKPSRFTVVFFYANLVLFLYLFSRFYSQSYSKNKHLKNNLNTTTHDNNEVNYTSDNKNGKGYELGVRKASNKNKNRT